MDASPHHLGGRPRVPEGREFYVRLAVRERLTKRELERQLRAATFERAVITPTKVSALMAQTHPHRKLLREKLHDLYTEAEPKTG